MSTTDLSGLVDDRAAQGVFRVHRDVFRDPAVFAREIAEFFENGWVFAAHESQLPRPHDFLTLQVGRQPLVLARDGAGQLHGLHNACRHKGALVCHERQGNRRTHVCRYHGWAYASDGRNLLVKDRQQGGYSPAFDDESHDLQPVAHLQAYRGFVFVCLARVCEPLDVFLGDARTLIDLAVDQAPDGLEVVPGTVRYRYRGNWKLQLENSLDAYHFRTTHSSYLRLLERRAAAPARADVQKAIWQGNAGSAEQMGAFALRNGHAMVWTTSPKENHPLYEQLDQVVGRVGAVRADWMMRTRQLNVFPNLQVASNAALQMRVIRPLAVDLTEIDSFCLAPVGETPERRRRRLRQYEDFFNPSGLATPDDTVTYEDCQRGFGGTALDWLQGHARGMSAVRAGADEHASEIGVNPETSMSGSFDMSDETVYHGFYRNWLARLQGGPR